jgi:hypothetical protein
MTAVQPETMTRALEAVCMLLMPFFLLGAGDDQEKARAAVADLLRSYNPATVQELDLAARVIGFSAAALDNLRLSVGTPTLSDTKVLRYRSTAVSLSRSAEQCRATLKRIQTDQPEKPIPLPAPAKRPTPLPPMTTGRLEKAKDEARDLMAGIARLGAACAPGQGLTAIHHTPSPGAQMTAAVAAALKGNPIPAILARPR